MKQLLKTDYYVKIKCKLMIPISYTEYDYKEIEQITDFIHYEPNFERFLEKMKKLRDTTSCAIEVKHTLFKRKPYIKCGWLGNRVYITEKNFKDFAIVERVRKWEPTLKELYSLLSADKAKAYLSDNISQHIS